jgi:hypothetical protein
METNSASIGRRMDKESVMYTHLHMPHLCTSKAVLGISHGKEGNPAVCDNTEEPRGHYSK